MADPNFVELLKQGSEVWNSWREQHPASLQIDLNDANLSGTDLSYANLNYTNLIRANLSNADLDSADLRGANLNNADLQRANLSRVHLMYANLSNANLSRADLIGTNLRYANLSDADLSDADLNYANLNNANLSDVNMSRSNLNDADLSDANLNRTDLKETSWRNVLAGGTLFSNLDLRIAIGLETVRHLGPSTIGLDTIYLSHGQIPEPFLRGAGVPETFITNMRFLVDSMSPIEFYSCFISYSHENEDFARRLYADLQREGVRCWFAPEDMKIGDKLRSRIDESIRLYDKLLLVLSEHSVASDWVEHEVETALAKERKGQHTVLFPVRLDNAILEQEHDGWPTLVQDERHIGDFTRWKDHDSYQLAFERLLRDLKAEAKGENGG